MKAFLNWLDNRTGYKALMREALYEPIPGGARWRYVWGSTLTFTFVVQVITGMLLWTAYSPSAQTAWESIYFIQHQMTAGWLVRGIHHFAAQAMVVLLALHFLQVVVDGAYKAPREINFWLGIVLMQIVLALSLTGYLLPWDQKGYYATKVATNIMGATPLVGPQLQQLVQGGSEYGHHTLTRFFALHAGILPALLVMFLGMHLYVFRRHQITPAHPDKNPKFAVWLTLLAGPLGLFYSNAVAASLLAAIDVGVVVALMWLKQSAGLDAWVVLAIGLPVYLGINALFLKKAKNSAAEFSQDDSHFWPDQVLKDAVACMAVLATVLGLTLYFQYFGHGVELTAPADASEKFSAARPEWYFLFLFQFLKFEWVEHLGLVFGAIVVPGLIVGVIVAMPILGKWKLGHRFNVAFVLALLIGCGILTTWAVIEDKNNDEVVTAKATAGRDGRRTVELAKAYGIETTARDLLRDDPLTQGPKLFKRNCSACHRYEGHDGTGAMVMDLDPRTKEKIVAKPTAADMGNFGDREWWKSLLTDYRGHFAALKHAKDASGKAVGDDFLGEFATMAGWSADHRELLNKKENAESLKALIEFLVYQSRRNDLSPYDKKLVADGRRIFEKGKLASGSFTSNCIECHSLKPVGEEKTLQPEDGPSAPTLTNYGGDKWLRGMILNPAHDDYYGLAAANAMPAFDGRLTTKQLELLTKWMTGDYLESELEQPASKRNQLAEALKRTGS